MDDSSVVYPEGKKLLQKVHTRTNSVVPLTKPQTPNTDRDKPRPPSTDTAAAPPRHNGPTVGKTAAGTQTVLLDNPAASYSLWAQAANSLPPEFDRRVSSFVSSPDGRFLCVMYHSKVTLLEHTPDDQTSKFKFLGSDDPNSFRKPYVCFSPDSRLLICAHTGSEPGMKEIRVFATETFTQSTAKVMAETMDIPSSHMFVHEDKKGDCFEGEFDLVTPQGVVIGLWGERLDTTLFRCHYLDLRDVLQRLQSSEGDIPLNLYQLKPTVSGCDTPSYDIDGHSRYFFSLLRGNKMAIISGETGESNWHIRLFSFKIDFKQLKPPTQAVTTQTEDATPPQLDCQLHKCYDTKIEGTDLCELSDLYSKVSPGDMEFYLYDNEQKCLRMYAILPDYHYANGNGGGYMEPKVITVFEGEIDPQYTTVCVRGDNRYAVINRNGSNVELYFRASYEHPYKLFHSVPLRGGNYGEAELSTDMKYLMISRSTLKDIEVYPLYLPNEGAKLLMPIFRPPKSGVLKYLLPLADAVLTFINGELHWANMSTENYAGSVGSLKHSAAKEAGESVYCTGVIPDPLGPSDGFIACIQITKTEGKTRNSRFVLYRGQTRNKTCQSWGEDISAKLGEEHPRRRVCGQAIIATQSYSHTAKIYWIVDQLIQDLQLSSPQDSEERLDWEVNYADLGIVIATSANADLQRVTISEPSGVMTYLTLENHTYYYGVNPEFNTLIVGRTGGNEEDPHRDISFIDWKTKKTLKKFQFDKDFVIEPSIDGSYVLVQEEKLERMSVLRITGDIDRCKISQKIICSDTFGISSNSKYFWFRDASLKHKFSIQIWSIEEVKPLHKIDLFQYPNYSVRISISKNGVLAWGSNDSRFDCVRFVNFMPSKNMLVPLANHFLETYNGAEPESEEQKKALSSISTCSQIVPKWMIPNYHLTTTLTYLLNDEQTFREWLEFIGHDVIFNAHNLLELFFSNFQAKSTAQLTFLEYFNFKDKFGDYPKIDGAKFNQILLETPDLLVRDELRRKITSSLLVINVGKAILTELADEDLSTAILPIEEDPFKRKNIHQSIQKVIQSLSSNPSSSTDTKEEDKQADSANNESYQPHRSLVKLDLSNGSKQSMALMAVLQKMSDSELKTRLRPLVYFKWYKIYWFVLCYCLIYWGACIVGYIYYSNPVEQSQLAGPLLGLCSALVLFELKCLWSQGPANYFGQLWNWTDLSILGFNLAVTIFLMVLPDDHSFNVYAINWVRVMALVTLWIRGTTWMRVFKSTRYLITMVLQVFLDFIPFLAVFATVIFLFAFLWRMSAGLGELEPSEPLGFYESLYDSVMIIFGNSPDQETIASVVRFVIIVIGNIVLALVFANFLIAIISGTFERINEEKDLYDIKELLSMIQDFDSFLSPMFTRKRSQSQKGGGEYFLTLLKTEEDNNEFTAQLESIHNEIKELTSNFSLVGSRLDRLEQLAAKSEKNVAAITTAQDTFQPQVIKSLEDLINRLENFGAQPQAN